MTLPEGKFPGSSGVRGPWGERVGPQGESWKVPFSVSPRALEVPRIAPPVGQPPAPTRSPGSVEPPGPVAPEGA